MLFAGGPSGLFVDINVDSGKERPSFGNGQADGHHGQKPLDHAVDGIPDDGFDRSGHTDVTHISCSATQDTGIDGADVCMCPEHGADPPVEVVAEGNLFRGSFGMKIDDDDRRTFRQAFEQRVHTAEGTIVVIHERASYKVYHHNVVLDDVTPARDAGRVVIRPDNRCVRIQIGDDLLVGPDMVSGGDNINAVIEKFPCCCQR